AKTGTLLHPNRGSLSNGRSTRPGCEGALARLPFAPRAVLLHPNRNSPRTVGAPAPGAQVRSFDSLSHRGRCSYIQTGILLHQKRGSPRTVGAPAPGAKGLTGAPGVSRRAVLRPDNRIH